MSKILILANNDIGLYKFRKELIQKLICEGNNVCISLPYGENVDFFIKNGCEFIDTPIDRRGTNPISDLRLLVRYLRVINKFKPDIVLTYTIKPNVYGGIACRLSSVKYIANVTGLGTAMESKGFIGKVAKILYKIGLANSKCVFFQNKSNLETFRRNKLIKSKAKLIPGSGVNIEEHCFESYPDINNDIKLLFIGRIMKAKGIDELLETIPRVKDKHKNVLFEIVGFTEEEYSMKLQEYENDGLIKFHGLQLDVHSFIKQSHATILPSYHEGTSNVLLESAASGRPVLASNVPGCVETFDEGISGFGFEVRNSESLYETIMKFIELSYEQKVQMGLMGRNKMINEYDRNIVINSYLEEIKRGD